MKKTLFALSALSLILAGCDSEEATAQTQPPAQAETQDNIQLNATNESQADIQLNAANESQADLLAQTDDLETITSPESEPANNSSDSMKKSDWQGTYSGILPCADCDGIETKLTLNQDETYQLEENYLGKQDGVFNSTGAVQWDETGTTITLVNDNGSEPVKYVLEGNSLAKLDTDGQPVSGDMAALYQLTKEN